MCSLTAALLLPVHAAAHAATYLYLSSLGTGTYLGAVDDLADEQVMSAIMYSATRGWNVIDTGACTLWQLSRLWNIMQCGGAAPLLAGRPEAAAHAAAAAAAAAHKCMAAACRCLQQWRLSTWQVSAQRACGCGALRPSAYVLCAPMPVAAHARVRKSPQHLPCTTLRTCANPA